MRQKSKNRPPQDTDAPLRFSHAEATEILNKPGRYVVMVRPRGTTCVTPIDNNGQGYTAEEASALVAQFKRA